MLPGQAAAALDIGSVVPLDAMLDDHVEVRADGRLIAHGRAVIVEGRLGIRIERIVSPLGGGQTTERKWTSDQQPGHSRSS